GEVAVGAAGLRHQPPADPLLRREVVVEGDDMLLLVGDVEEQRGGDAQRQLPAEAPGGIRSEEGVVMCGAPAPGVAQAVVVEWVGGPRAQPQAEDGVVELLVPAAVPPEGEGVITAALSIGIEPSHLAKEPPIVVV